MTCQSSYWVSVGNR